MAGWRVQAGVLHRPGRRASARPFCLLVCALLFSGCGWWQRPGTPRLTVEVVEGRQPVQGENRLELRVFSGSAHSRALVAYLERVSPSGGRLRSEQRLQVPGGKTSRFELIYEAGEAGIHRASVRLYDLARGSLVHETRDLRLLVRPRWEFTQDRSYYTGERAVRFGVRLNRRDEVGKRVAVTLRGERGRIAAVDLALNERRVEGQFDATSLPLGRYELSARLYGGDGTVDSLSVAFERHPAAARQVKIDLFSRSLLVDGEPFFPIGLYWLRVGLLGEVARLGFNSGDYFYKLQGEEIAALMDAAAEERIGVLLELSDFIRGREEPDRAAIEATVERYRRHPALLAWYIIDAPIETNVRPEHVEEIYRRIRELDPHHPVYLVNNRPHTYADYLGGSDILAVDVYPVPRYPLTRVRESVQAARWTSLDRKPVWLVAQAFGGVEHWPRPPTAVELRNMVFQGLVHGARGILFYRYCGEEERAIQPPALWREVRTLAAELADLAPVLVTAEPKEEVFGTRGVDVMLREYQGAYYLFAVNVTRAPQRLHLLLYNLLPLRSAQGLLRSRKPRLQNGVFDADIEPLGVGIYRLEKSIGQAAR